jgi:hypothetical protein
LAVIVIFRFEGAEASEVILRTGLIGYSFAAYNELHAEGRNGIPPAGFRAAAHRSRKGTWQQSVDATKQFVCLLKMSSGKIFTRQNPTNRTFECNVNAFF